MARVGSKLSEGGVRLGDKEGSWVSALGELGGWWCHLCDGDRKGRLGENAELNWGPVGSELPRNMKGRRQLVGKNWAGGADLLWRMRRYRGRGGGLETISQGALRMC